jgi:hypothetical protein
VADRDHPYRIHPYHVFHKSEVNMGFNLSEAPDQPAVPPSSR